MTNDEQYQNQMNRIRSKYEKDSLAIKMNADLNEGARSEKLRALTEERDSATADLKEQRKQEMIQRKDSL